MKTSERLTKLLEAEGFIIERMWAAQGAYRSAPWADCYRWEAIGRRVSGGNTPIAFGGWDTMTECVKYGITITQDESSHWHYEVHADAPVTLPE